MKRFIAILLVLPVGVATEAAPAYVPRSGDIVFQTSRSAQSLAIQRATHSRYSHMGMVFVERGRPLVFEAVQPVKYTPLEAWIKRGQGGHFVAKRLRNADRLLTPESVEKLVRVAKGYVGRDYDLYFEWSDERIYCSELVWKVYQRALGIELGHTEALRNFDLSDPAVKAKMQERWDGAPPLHERVISPAAIFASGTLVTVGSR